jgi:hypothetical protein
MNSKYFRPMKREEVIFEDAQLGLAILFFIAMLILPGCAA